MSSILDLDRKSILVTSSEGQAEVLCGLIESNGGVAVRCPSVLICPTSDPEALNKILALVSAMDFLIFLSQNAVDYGCEALGYAGISLPLGVKVIAIGPATENALKDRGIDVAAVGSAPFSSESLLKLNELTERNGRSIMIFQGEDGRPWLSEKLIDDGVRVFQAFCYQRSLPSRIDPKVIEHWETDGIDLIIFSSLSAAENLWYLLKHRAKKFLQHTSIVVASARIESGCRNLGYCGVISVAADASQKGLLQAMDTHFLANDC